MPLNPKLQTVILKRGCLANASTKEQFTGGLGTEPVQAYSEAKSPKFQYNVGLGFRVPQSRGGSLLIMGLHYNNLIPDPPCTLKKGFRV